MPSDGDLVITSAGDLYIAYTEPPTYGVRMLGERAQMMLSWLPTFFQTAPEYQAAMQGLGAELDRLEAARQRVIAQSRPETADILLDAWELVLVTSVAPPGVSLDDRRRRVMVQWAKLTHDPSGLGWRANVTLLVGTGWSYEEYVPPDQRRLNLAGNPRAEVDATGYAQNVGTGSLARVTTAHPDEVGGTHAIEQTNPGRGANEGVRIASAAVSDPAGTYTVSVFVEANAPMNLALDLDERDGSDLLLGVTALPFRATTGFQRVSVTRAFAGGVKLGAVVRADGTAAGTFRILGVLFERADAMDDYFDGSMAGFEWLGTADESESRATSPDADTIAVTLPYAPDSDLYARTERLLREITPAHIDLALGFTSGFVLDVSVLDEEPLG